MEATSDFVQWFNEIVMIPLIIISEPEIVLAIVAFSSNVYRFFIHMSSMGKRRNTLLGYILLA